MDDEGRNPIDFGSLGHRSRSTLPPCEGMLRFALSSWNLLLALCLKRLVNAPTLMMLWPHIYDVPVKQLSLPRKLFSHKFVR